MNIYIPVLALLLVFGATYCLGNGSMECSKCGSGNTQRLEDIFESDTRKAIPPAKKSLKWPIIGVCISILFLINGGETIVFGLIIIASSSFLGYQAIQFNSRLWPGLYKHWQECWMCRQCGNIFHHP